jgi:hypothetical protein
MNLLDVAGVWRALESWDRERPRSFTLPECRVQLYMGAMEIPMLALRPRALVIPDDDQLTGWGPQLKRLNLVLDCVAVSANYKLNRAASGEYGGRILPDALKFHADRLLALGPEALADLGALYLALPSATGDTPP